MAWRNAREATHHTDALRLTAALAAYLGLSDTSAARIPLERYLDNELAANPGRFSPTDAPLRVLQQLLREDLNGFQKTLSPILPDDAYGRYQELLDSLRLTAR